MLPYYFNSSSFYKQESHKGIVTKELLILTNTHTYYYTYATWNSKVFFIFNLTFL